MQTINSALLVSERSLGADQNGRFLLTVNNKNVVEYHPVEVGTLNNGMRVIEKGITDDAHVIVKGLQRVIPGSVVTPQGLDSGDKRKKDNPKDSQSE